MGTLSRARARAGVRRDNSAVEAASRLDVRLRPPTEPAREDEASAFEQTKGFSLELEQRRAATAVLGDEEVGTSGTRTRVPPREVEMSLGAIDAVTAYGLDTTALRVESPPTWPSPPRSLPVGVLLRSNGASALLNACEMFGIRARVVAIPESEPVRAMYGGADVEAAREAAAQASALLGVELACDFKARLAPTRAENVYA